jgi:hypothetical protein
VSTPADIRTAWNTKVWQHATIQAITTKIYAFEISDDSETEAALLSFAQRIRFIEYVCSRSIASQEMGGSSRGNCNFPVEVRYTLEKVKPGDPFDGAGFNAVIDFFTTLIALVQSELAPSWNSTVDYFEFQDGAPEVTTQEVAGIECWRGVYRFNGVQNTSL